MDGFLTDDELPAAAAFVKEGSGSLPSHPRAAQLLEQITAVAPLTACALKASQLERLVKLSGMVGFMFDADDRSGKIVASSMRIGLG